MGAYDHVRCLLCTAGREETVVRTIGMLCLGEAIFPRKVRRIRRNGEWQEDRAALLPGYVFVYTVGERERPEDYLRLDGVMRVLRYGEEKDGWLYGDDLAFADWIRERDGMLGTLTAIEEGDWVRVDEGLLKEMRGRVVRVDRRKQIACVEMSILGGGKRVWLSYELLKPDKASAGPAELPEADGHTGK